MRSYCPKCEWEGTEGELKSRCIKFNPRYTRHGYVFHEEDLITCCPKCGAPEPILETDKETLLRRRVVKC